MKKALALILAVLMCVTLAACKSTSPSQSAGTPGGTSKAPATQTPAADDDFSGDVTLMIMLMPQGDNMNEDTVSKVKTAVNARIAELGYKFKVDFTWSGGAWNFDKLDQALQTGAANLDIIPAHSWSGSVSYTVGAQTGQYLRLDNPDDNLLEKYGKDLYAKASSTVKTAANVNGDQGFGIYGYIIEKDAVTENGYLVNKTVLEELGFKVEDFKAGDIASWEPIFAAYKAAYPDKYPFNAEGEVLSRTANYIAFVDGTTSTLGYVFDGKDKKDAIVSRYETQSYKDFIAVMQGYYAAGYIDPDLTVPGEISAGAFSSTRDAGDYLVSTMVWTPGYDAVYSASASAAQGKDVEIIYTSPWKSAIGTSETAQASGLAVYSGTKYAPEAVTFLNMLASDTVIGNLIGEGIEGESYEAAENGTIKRINDRAGWNIWRYGVIGANSGATTLWDVDKTGNEWVNLKSFNDSAEVLPITGWMFERGSVDAQTAACKAIIEKYSVPLGTGASSDYDAFITEMKAAGLDDIVAAADAQYSEFKAAK